MEQAEVEGLRADQHCFIGHSQKAPWRQTFQQVCEEVLPQFGLQPWYADRHYQGSMLLRDKVVSMIATTRCGIYDLSWWRENEWSGWNMPRNVLIELGMAIALNRPMLLLRHGSNGESGLSLPACLEGIEIGEFGDGERLLKKSLQARLPWLTQDSPQQDMLNLYCHFGGLQCSSREAHPRLQQSGRRTMHVQIADGAEPGQVARSDFREMIEEKVLSRFRDLDFSYLDDRTCPPDRPFLLCARCQEVRASSLAIYHITPHTSTDTFIAIGMNLALEKQFGYSIPKILIADSANALPSLLWGYDIIEQRSYAGIRDRLNAILPAVIEECRQSGGKAQHLPFTVILPEKEGRKQGPSEGTAARDSARQEAPPGQEGVAEQAPPSNAPRKRPIKIFIAYAPEDRVYVERIKKQLFPLQQQGLIEMWDRGEILAGADIKGEIERHLKAAEVILVLVSPDFLASEFCYGKEMQWAMEQRTQGAVNVVPIILRPCDWKRTSFGELEALPTKGKAVSRWLHRDDAYADIVVGIYRVVEGKKVVL